MDDKLPIIAVSDAAEEKGCHRTTIYRAIERGELNVRNFGGRRVIKKDEKWRGFEPSEK